MINYVMIIEDRCMRLVCKDRRIPDYTCFLSSPFSRVIVFIVLQFVALDAKVVDIPKGVRSEISIFSAFLILVLVS